MDSICSVDVYEMARKRQIASCEQPTKREKMFLKLSCVAFAITVVFILVQMLLSADVAIKTFCQTCFSGS